MKSLVAAIGVVALGFAASTAARADFAVVKFKSGYCRVWTDVKAGPQDGAYLLWRNHHRVHAGLRTQESADKHMHWAVAHKRCQHWW